MAKTPEENARAGVEKALKALDKATEKRDSLQDKYDEAVATEKRANREVVWAASHPDLPEDFDIDEFRQELAQPFDQDVIADADFNEEGMAAIADDRDELERQKEIQADDDDPFGEAV